MTRNQSDEIIKRLDRIEQELTDVRTELAETRGAYRLGRFILGFLSVGGVGALLMWMTGQSGK
jgi:tetrahydromethanopterin S-methyltransferase subunit G